jgi:hypothetical protein
MDEFDRKVLRVELAQLAAHLIEVSQQHDPETAREFPEGHHRTGHDDRWTEVATHGIDADERKTVQRSRARDGAHAVLGTMTSSFP